MYSMKPVFSTDTPPDSLSSPVLHNLLPCFFLLAKTAHCALQEWSANERRVTHLFSLPRGWFIASDSDGLHYRSQAAPAPRWRTKRLFAGWAHVLPVGPSLVMKLRCDQSSSFSSSVLAMEAAPLPMSWIWLSWCYNWHYRMLSDFSYLDFNV